MSLLELIDDLITLIDCITDLPRFWRVYVGIFLTFIACVLAASTQDSPDGPGLVLGVTLVIGIGLTLLWQRAAH